MEHQAITLPTEAYYVAGVIVLTNIGTIVSLIFAAFKTVWWASKLDSRVDEARATAVRAHKRIDILENNSVSAEEVPTEAKQ